MTTRKSRTDPIKAFAIQNPNRTIILGSISVLKSEIIRKYGFETLAHFKNNNSDHKLVKLKIFIEQ